MDKETLARLLAKDEIVLWSGKPAPYKILDESYRPVFIRNYVITVAIVAALIAAALIASAKGSTNINMIPLVVLLCIPLVVLPVRLISYNGYKRRCNYFVTNKNILVYVSDSQKKLFPLSEIDGVESVPQGAGTLTIRTGKAVGIPVKKNRDYAMNCLVSETGGETKKGCLLYNLSEKDARTVLDMINKYRVVA